MDKKPDSIQKHNHQQAKTGLQTYLNELLVQLTEGNIRTPSALCCTVKKQWKKIDIHQFPHVYHYVTNLISIMDESLKLFPAFPFTGDSFSYYADDVYLTGSVEPDSQLAKAWIFFSGTNEKKQYVLYRSMQFLEDRFPENPWSLYAVDMTTGERFCRQKHYG